MFDEICIFMMKPSVLSASFVIDHVEMYLERNKNWMKNVSVSY